MCDNTQEQTQAGVESGQLYVWDSARARFAGQVYTLPGDAGNAKEPSHKQVKCMRQKGKPEGCVEMVEGLTLSHEPVGFTVPGMEERRDG